MVRHGRVDKGVGFVFFFDILCIGNELFLETFQVPISIQNTVLLVALYTKEFIKIEEVFLCIFIFFSKSSRKTCYIPCYNIGVYIVL